MSTGAELLVDPTDSHLDRPALIAHTWLGLAWASLLGQFFAVVYADSLLAIGPQPSLLLLALLLLPGLIAIPAIRARSHRAPLLALLAAFAPWIEPIALRASVLGLGLAGVSLALLTAAMSRRRGLAVAWSGGILLSCSLRWCCGSLDPLASVPWLAAGSCIATGCAGLVARASDTEPTTRGRALAGVPFGAATYLVHGWFLGPTVIARWAGLGPENGLLVVLALAAGVLLLPALRAPAACAGVAGIALLAMADRSVALAGGCALALALPTVWTCAVTTLARGGCRAVAAAAFTHLALFLLQAAAFALDYTGGTRHWPAVLVAIALATATLAALPALCGRNAGDDGRHWPMRLALAALAFVLATIGSPAANMQAAGARDVAMTWNLQQGFTTGGRCNLRAVADTVQAEGVTLLAAQEVDATGPVSAGRDLVAWLAAELGMHAASGPGPKQATFGLALLSSHPILEARLLLVPSLDEHAVLLLATVDVRGRPLQVAVTHFGGPPEHRQAQARAVGNALAAVSGPLLLLGDFNLASDAPPIEAMLRAARLQATSQSQQPTHADGAVDHVFVRDVACEQPRIPDSGGISDHRPVVVPFAAPASKR